MHNRTQKPPDQPSPTLPEPSYARQVLTTMANEMQRTGNRRDLINEITLRRTYTVAVAATLHQLPTPVADEVAAKVAGQLPDPTGTLTRGECTTRLRELAAAA